MPKTKNPSLANIRQTVVPYTVRTRSKNQEWLDAQSERKREQQELEALALAAVPDLDAMVVPDDDDDDDYIAKIPGRPGAPRTTWFSVYGHRKDHGKGFVVRCEEPSCCNLNGRGRVIVLDGKNNEVQAGSTPHGKPRKPPVCHQVSWAALEFQLLQMVSRKNAAGGSMRMNEAFRRAVCWELSNLHPGHNVCNSAGVKTTAANLAARERQDADAVIDHVSKTFSGSIWMP